MALTAEKLATGVKSGKHATSDLRGKLCNRCQGRETRVNQVTATC